MQNPNETRQDIPPSDPWATRAVSTAERILHRAFNLMFVPANSGWESWLQAAWFLGICVAGAIVWAYILNWGRINFLYSDWAEGMGHRLAFLQDAVRTGQLPLNMPDASALRNITDRYLSIPDTIISPQFLLLGLMSLGGFVVFNTLLLYGLGCWGLWSLARKYTISPVPLSMMLLIFVFNGHITDHIVVGHIHWVGYFLLPWFVYLILQAIEEPTGWPWVLKMSLLLFAMFLQGAFHLFVMSLLFMGLLAISNRRLLPVMTKGGIFAILVSMFRILPPALEAGKFDSAFLSGFDSAFQLVSSTVVLRFAEKSQVFLNDPLNPLGWWELDHYIGFVGLALVVVFGIGLWFRRQPSFRQYRELIFPIMGMTVLSIGRIYKPINALGVPLLSSQRVSSRFFIFALVFLLVLATFHLQRWLDERKLSNASRAVLVGALVVLANDLWQHEKLWRVRHLPDMFNARAVDLSLAYVANHPDPVYIATLVAGLIVTCGSVGFLIWATLRQRGRENPPSPRLT